MSILWLVAAASLAALLFALAAILKLDAWLRRRRLRARGHRRRGYLRAREFPVFDDQWDPSE